MTTLAERRAELVTAMATGGVTISDAPGAVQPPVGYVFGDGSDLRGIGRGQIVSSFRVSLVAGQADAPAASAQLGDLILAALAVLRALPGWRLGEIRPDRIVSIAGGDYLAADVTASALIDV